MLKPPKPNFRTDGRIFSLVVPLGKHSLALELNCLFGALNGLPRCLNISVKKEFLQRKGLLSYQIWMMILDKSTVTNMSNKWFATVNCGQYLGLIWGLNNTVLSIDISAKGYLIF